MPVILGKCLQTPVQEPALVWPIKKAGKYLVLSAHPRRHGISIVPEKPAGATASGNLAAVCRTWGESLFLPAIWYEAASRTWWLPFGADSQNPRAYARLTGGSAPEITLIECGPEPCVRMRLATGGIFTKRRPLDFLLPHQLPGGDRQGLQDILPGILDEVAGNNATEVLEPEAAVTKITDTTGADDLLPLYQREARDRLARRVKTLRKSLQNQENRKPLAPVVDEARARAFELREAGRGREMDVAFKELKHLEKSLQEATQHLTTLRDALAAAESDLARLRGTAIAEDDVSALLRRHGIKPQVTQGSAKAPRPVASDWHEFALPDGTKLMVGKGAAESDRLVKSAATNDWWLHVVGGTGSHVIVPARQFKGKDELPPAVLRAAGMLAIHYSKLREGCAGEVYVTRKGNLRKRKGDPAGLWQIDRSGSVMIRYDAAELAALFKGER
jgi:hypothetical protein